MPERVNKWFTLPFTFCRGRLDSPEAPPGLSSNWPAQGSKNPGFRVKTERGLYHAASSIFSIFILLFTFASFFTKFHLFRCSFNFRKIYVNFPLTVLNPLYSSWPVTVPTKEDLALRNYKLSRLDACFVECILKIASIKTLNKFDRIEVHRCSSTEKCNFEAKLFKKFFFRLERLNDSYGKISLCSFFSQNQVGGFLVG